MEEALVAYLLAALGGEVGNRIWWLRRPQASAVPAITLQVVSGTPEYTLAGREGMVGRLVQFDLWAASYPSMKTVERAVIAALDGLNETPFQGAFVEAQRETWETQGERGSAGFAEYYRSSLDVRVWHAAAV